MRNLRGATAMVAVLALWNPGGAQASGPGSHQTVTAALTTHTPGTPTGVTVTATYSDGRLPAGRPPRLTRVIDALPSGTAIHGDTVPSCGLSDAELLLLGPAACPAGSVVGSGHVLLDFGLPGGIGATTADVTLINAGREVLFFGALPGTTVGLVAHGTVRGSAVDVALPKYPAADPDGASVLREDFTITEASALLTAPGRCPTTGHWNFRRTHSYSDGVTQAVRVALPCRHPAVRHRGRR